MEKVKKFISKLNNFILNYGFLTLSLIAVILGIVFRIDLDVQVYGLLIIQYLAWIIQKLHNLVNLLEIQIMQTQILLNKEENNES